MKFILLLIFSMALTCQSYSQILPDQSTMMARAQDKFKVLFKTTKGNFEIEVIREWSPLAADRFYQLVASGFYQSCAFFRVQKGYVVQFGIGDHPEINNFWDKKPIEDEPVRTSNLKGTLSFARDGLNSRTMQLFINLKDNFKLDTVNFNGSRGFPPFARTTKGFETIEQFFSGYGFEPANYQDSIMVSGNGYLKKRFPELDYLIEARIIEE